MVADDGGGGGVVLCEVLRVADDGGEGWCCVRCSGWQMMEGRGGVV